MSNQEYDHSEQSNIKKPSISVGKSNSTNNMNQKIDNPQLSLSEIFSRYKYFFLFSNVVTILAVIYIIKLA